MLPKVESIPVTDETDRHGCYHVEPLETGFGQTLGNALRRVLLSSLPGAAITSVKIDSVYHEFSAIPHIKEDVTEFVLNLKEVRLRSFADRPIQCRIEAAAGGVVTAADIICPPEVEVVSPEQVLATLDGPDSRLSVELTVEKGRGYVPCDQREGLAIGVIPIDAIYTPVRKVNYKVEPTRVGQVTDFERLVLDVWTDGTIEPDEAVSEASKVLIRHFELFTALSGEKLVRPEKAQIGGPGIPTKLYDTPIEDLDLTVRAYNCLKRAGITKVGQVLEMTEDDLLGVRNFGKKSLDELRERLGSRGLLEHSKLKAEEELSDEMDEGDESEEIDESEEAEEYEESSEEDEEGVGEAYQSVAEDEDDESEIAPVSLIEREEVEETASEPVVAERPIEERAEVAPAAEGLVEGQFYGTFEDFDEEDETEGGGRKGKKRRRGKETSR